MGMLADIRNHLIAQNVVEGTTGWKCFLGLGPEVQDKLVLLQATGGEAADTHRNENQIATFQATVRGSEKAYEEVEAQWYAVFNALQDAGPTGGSPDPLAGYALIQALQCAPSPFYDEKMRVCMTVNFRVVRARP